MGKRLARGCALLTGKRCPDSGEVMATVPDRMILKNELACERGIAVERHGRGAIQFFIAESAYGLCRSSRQLRKRLWLARRIAGMIQ